MSFPVHPALRPILRIEAEERRAAHLAWLRAEWRARGWIGPKRESVAEFLARGGRVQQLAEGRAKGIDEPDTARPRYAPAAAPQGFMEVRP